MRQSKRWKDVNDCLGLIGALVELKQDLQLHPQRIYRDVNGKIKDDSLYKKGSLGLIVAIDSKHNDDITIRMLRGGMELGDGDGVVSRQRERIRMSIEHDFKIISMPSGRGTM